MLATRPIRKSAATKTNITAATIQEKKPEIETEIGADVIAANRRQIHEEIKTDTQGDTVDTTGRENEMVTTGEQRERTGMNSEEMKREAIEIVIDAGEVVKSLGSIVIAETGKDMAMKETQDVGIGAEAVHKDEARTNAWLPSHGGNTNKLKDTFDSQLHWTHDLDMSSLFYYCDYVFPK